MKQRILLTGKDGIDLLQRITTLDFNRLPQDRFQPGLILNAQGKILSYFEVLKHNNQDQIEIEFQDQFLELLDQYTFSERYQITQLPTPAQRSVSDRERIQARTPKLGNEFHANGETNPLEINLQQAIHDQKGCYPGQEVIEKIIAIGSPAKKLCRIRLTEGDPSSITLPLDLDHGKLTSFENGEGLAIVRKTHVNPGSKITAAPFVFEVVE